MKLVFGGTFDPVHNGHIQMAQELSELIGVKPVHLMPCYQAVHKSSVSASAAQRLDMLQLASQACDALVIDDREIRRQHPSFTYDSLIEIRNELGNESLALVMGSDTARGLGTWKNISEFSGLCHLIVMQRPDEGENKPSSDVQPRIEGLGWKVVEDVSELAHQPAGLCHFVCLTQMPVSSSAIRQCIRKKLPFENDVPNEVAAYICDNALYDFSR